MNSSKISKEKAPDPYKVLGLARTVDAGEIKRAYFQLVRQYSPESEPEKFQQIRAAYDQIRTPERRAQADLLLLQPPPPLPEANLVDFDLTVHREDIFRIVLELALSTVSPRADFQPLEPPVLK